MIEKLLLTTETYDAISTIMNYLSLSETKTSRNVHPRCLHFHSISEAPGKILNISDLKIHHFCRWRSESERACLPSYI